jgi:hypothetical protein
MLFTQKPSLLAEIDCLLHLIYELSFFVTIVFCDRTLCKTASLKRITCAVDFFRQRSNFQLIWPKSFAKELASVAVSGRFSTVPDFAALNSENFISTIVTVLKILG